MRVSPWPFVPAPNARGTEDGQVLRNLGLGFITRDERAHSVQATATKPARFGYATRLLGLLLRSYGKASLTLVRRDFPNISPLALKRDTSERAKTKPNTKRPLIGCCTAPWSSVAPCSCPAHTAASAGCSSPLPSLCLTARPPVLLSSGAAAFARPRSAITIALPAATPRPPRMATTGFALARCCCPCPSCSPALVLLLLLVQSDRAIAPSEFESGASHPARRARPCRARPAGRNARRLPARLLCPSAISGLGSITMNLRSLDFAPWASSPWASSSRKSLWAFGLGANQPPYSAIATNRAR